MNTQIEWQRVYSDLYPDNSAMRIECAPKVGLTRLSIISPNGIEVCYVFGQQQAFQAAFALLKSLDMLAHIPMYAPIPPSEVRP